MNRSGDGVILLHGIGRVASSMSHLDRAARAAGYQTLNIEYPGRSQDLAALASFVDEAAAPWIDALDGRVHFVTHSMGGLVARAFIRLNRPPKLGRAVMLGPPNQGSELADLLQHLSVYLRVFGPAGAQLVTARNSTLVDLLGPIDFELGIIAGNLSIDPISWAILPKPNDGKVTVARTEIEGMRDHVTMKTTHSLMMYNAAVIDAAISFLSDGAFRR